MTSARIEINAAARMALEENVFLTGTLRPYHLTEDIAVVEITNLRPAHLAYLLRTAPRVLADHDMNNPPSVIAQALAVYQVHTEEPTTVLFPRLIWT